MAYGLMTYADIAPQLEELERFRHSEYDDHFYEFFERRYIEMVYEKKVQRLTNFLFAVAFLALGVLFIYSIGR